MSIDRAHAPLPSAPSRWLASLGAPMVEAARGGRELSRLFASTLWNTLHRRRESGEVVRQMFQVGNRSLLFVTVTIGFIAMVSIYQVCLQLNQVTGDLSKVGAEFIKLLSHETAPTITAMMLCTRVGAGIAAEIGSMVVTEQVDALRMNGVDPITYLVVPRFLACLVMVPAIIIYATVVALGSGTAMAYWHFGVNPTVFLDPGAVRYGDLATGLVKAVAYGAAIPVISGYCGLSTHGGSEGVGSATTRAVINSSLAVIVLDFIIGTLAFLLFQSGRKGMIEFRGVHKSFGAQAVLRGLDLSIEKGEVMFVIGTSGVGKSVTIKHLIGLLQPDRGEILLDGAPVQGLKERDYYPIRKRCGMVFQHSTLFDSLSLLENVELPLRKHGRLRAEEARRRAISLLEIVHMEAYADRYPSELGDGMRKRAAIARTLALDPETILFDEPTTGLDPVSARRVDALIRELKGRGLTQIVVSHDLQSVFSTADRIAFIYRGVVHLLGTPAELRQCEDAVVQQFISGRSEGPMETPGF